MRLVANPSHFPRNFHVSTVAINAAEGITRQRLRWTGRAGQNHAAVQATGQRQPDWFLALKVPRNNAIPSRAQFFKVLRATELRLLLPGFLFEVGFPPDGPCGSEHPSRRSGNQRYTRKKGPILQHAAAGKELTQATVIEAAKFRQHFEERFGFAGK